MKKQWFFILFMLFVTSCSVVSTPTPTDSGVEGQAVQGPICPVVRVGEECPDQPYQAVITILSLEGKKVIQFQTDEQGNFHIPLAPGEYVLHPESPKDNPFPFAKEQTFVVHPGQFTTIMVLFDTGIR